jgi:hypothetical protein
MLPNISKTFKLTIIFLASVLVVFISAKPTSKLAFALECWPPPEPPEMQITDPTDGEKVSGTKNIKIDGDEGAEKIWIWIEYHEAGGGNGWRELYGDRPPKQSYPWDTTIDQNRSYCLRAYADFPSQVPPYKESQVLVVTVDNSTPPPSDPPPSQPQPPASEDPNGQQTSPQTTQQDTSQPTTTTTTKKSAEKKKAGEVEEAIVEEEIPITISAFDPDLFLKGGNVHIDEIKNAKKDDQITLQFSGTAKPNSLVTLYIFSKAVIAVVLADEAGNWVFEREDPIEAGKHTAFATIYDDGVTRRSDATEFFIARSSKEGTSLILKNTPYERFYPYAVVLVGTIVMAILILILYRIYSKRKPTKL